MFALRVRNNTSALKNGIQRQFGKSFSASPSFDDSLIQNKASPEDGLKGKTVFLSGASRGIGLAIAMKAAADGANVVIAAKTTEPHPKLEGTIYTAADAIEAAGGKALPLKLDIRSESNVKGSIEKAVSHFGGIDILVNSASAINLTGTEKLEMSRFDLMNSINNRGTFMVSKYCIPHLRAATNAHVLNLSPPLNMDPKWFRSHVGYTMAKYAMSMMVLGMSKEFKKDKIAFNALWPKTTISTAAVNNLLGGDALMQRSRIPEIMGDAAYEILTTDSRKCTGNFFIDEDVMRATGVTDFAKYKNDPELPESKLCPDFFL